MSGITLFRAHGEQWSLSRLLHSPVSFTPCMTEYVSHAYWRQRQLLFDSSAFGCFGRMVWQRPALLELAAQILPFKYLLDFKGTGLFVSKQMWHDGVPQSESICLDHCAFAWPCAWDEGTFRSHMEQKRCHTELLFMCFAECEIASNWTAVVLHFTERTIILSWYTCYCDVTLLK